MPSRTYLENVLSLTIQTCQRKGWLKAGAEFTWAGPGLEMKDLLRSLCDALEGRVAKGSCDGETLHLVYPARLDDYWIERVAEDWIELDWTPCTYGGQRPWFLCPGCGERVGKLFFQGRDGLRCRKCAALSYCCQSEAFYDRALRKAGKIHRSYSSPLWRAEHGLDFYPPKPKGMHWNTYEQRQEAFDEAFQVWSEHALPGMQRRSTSLPHFLTKSERGSQIEESNRRRSQAKKAS